MRSYINRHMVNTGIAQIKLCVLNKVKSQGHTKKKSFFSHCMYPLHACYYTCIGNVWIIRVWVKQITSYCSPALEKNQ